MAADVKQATGFHQINARNDKTYTGNAITVS